VIYVIIKVFILKMGKSVLLRLSHPAVGRRCHSAQDSLSESMTGPENAWFMWDPLYDNQAATRQTWP
jgi:hypothetical protein